MDEGGRWVWELSLDMSNHLSIETTTTGALLQDEGEDDNNELKEEGMVDKSCVNLNLNTHKHTMTLN